MTVTVKRTPSAAHYRGAGIISGNGSSRLLLDYKYENPEKYSEIMTLLFAPDERGMGTVHLKLEMGSDINSSSGTEPCVKRYVDEKTDVTRGAGFIIAADAKKINPDLALDMLYWSEPAWVTNASDVYAARYEWYMENLTEAYEMFGLKFDYVSVNRNEREVEAEWIKYFARRLRSEHDRPYDFTKIKIVAADEENAWSIGGQMMRDEELRNAVDIIGSHYTSHASEEVIALSKEYGKEVWFSEGSAPMTFAEGVSRFDGCGLTGINGILDISCRIAAMYPCGQMTLYEYQPAVSAYYDGVTYCHKQLITAAEPWSGFYEVNSGYYMALHLSRFFKKGWQFCDSACFCDGEKGGDGHAIVNAKHAAMTAYDEVSGDYSIFLVNPTAEAAKYDFEVTGLKNSPLNLWETRGNDGGAFDENYFRKIGAVIPEKGSFSIVLKPFSLLTVSTVDTIPPVFEKQVSRILPLPYKDDFTYSEHVRDYLSSRGNAPRYTTDQGGAFEVRQVNGSNVLMQMITPETKSMEWGFTPLPTTNFGDDRWNDYEFSSQVTLSESSAPDENFIGIGLRYSLASVGVSGYSLLLYESGKWEFRRNSDVLLSGSYPVEDRNALLKMTAVGREVNAFINGRNILSHTDSGALISAGRAALYSSYNNNCFSFVNILPIGESPYVTRFDDTDSCFEYQGEWKHELMSSFRSYKRTVSSSESGSFRFTFFGSSCGIFGRNEEQCLTAISLDGNEPEEKQLPSSGDREIFCGFSGLENALHTVKVTVLSGTLNVDGAQVGTDE